MTTACVFASICFASAAPAQPPRIVSGIVWQPDNTFYDPHGDWDKLGAHELIVQWTAVDGISFVPGAGFRRRRACRTGSALDVSLGHAM